MGSGAMPQLSLACYSAADALQRMEGKSARPSSTVRGAPLAAMPWAATISECG